MSHFIAEKLRLLEDQSLRRPQGWSQGPVCPAGLHIRVSGGPSPAFPTPLVTECSQVSPHNHGLGNLGGTQCSPRLDGSQEGPREGEGLPEQQTEAGFQKLLTQ